MTETQVYESITNNQIQTSSYGDTDSFQLSRKNYASLKKSSGSPSLQLPGSIQQKYEKIGSISSDTDAYEDDEKKIRELIKSFKAMIQYEEMNGLPGNRSLRLGIGVNPERFDEMISEARKIGVLKYIHINKIDKTNEFKELNAQRQSLEKNKNALIALKGMGGKIQELIELENKILEKEQNIQDLGVKLGDFDEENEFCTIKFLLSEKRLMIKPGLFPSIMRRLKVALEWTIKYYFLASMIIVFMSCSILILILLLEKFKVFFQDQINHLIKGNDPVEEVSETQPVRRSTSKKKGDK